LAEKRKYLTGRRKRLPLGRTAHFEAYLAAYRAYAAEPPKSPHREKLRREYARLYRTYDELYGELDPIEAKTVALAIARAKPSIRTRHTDQYVK